MIATIPSQSANAPQLASHNPDIPAGLELSLSHLQDAMGGVSKPPKLPGRNGANGLACWQIRKIVRHVEQNIHSSLRITDLGALVHLSSSHFSRNFRVSFGEAPYAYVLSRRIALAKDLIGTTDEPLSQIAHACGMCDQAHLCKLFRRIAGMTPHQWRQMRAASSSPYTADPQPALSLSVS
ncbi:AraC family transcriptional regulator [Affinirhizobium pseudoryzae]|uniref:AraC family transcriptional regulator n=1 Tax=Allorhizobium pseudoryzae TaxID=379684 RepID=UPI0013E9B0AC|nr:AraC family transcriptional regulator [Allorhizobium pseudoryzae]